MKKSGIKDVAFFIIVIVLVVVAVFSKVYTKEEETIIAVHIKGAVNNPGYYELPYGSRIKDAVELAGGETDRADINAVNLAMVLRDGEEIIIPQKELTK